MKIVTFSDLDTIIRFINNFSVVAMPTDTVVGLSYKVSKDGSGKKILNTIKGRNPDQPMLILASNVSQITNFDWGTPREIYKLQLISGLGPVTGIVSSGDKQGQAIRMVSPETFIYKLIESTGPIYSTSANKTGQEIPASINELVKIFGQEIDLYVKHETLPETIASTIVDLRDDQIKIVRPGIVTIEEIEQNLSK